MGGYTGAQVAGMGLVEAFSPRPSWWKTVLTVGTALVAGAMDVASEIHANKPMPESTAHKQIIDLYEQEAAKWAARSPGVTVNVINQAGASTAAVVPATPPSRYLLEEGHTDINTDCFSCADAHLAFMKAGLERAKGIVATKGVCNQDCKDWLGGTVREGMTLLAGDWPDDRVNALPSHQKVVIERYRQQVRDLTTGILGGSKQAAALNEGHGYLDESVRFVNAKDSIDHPDVSSRIRDAVPNLTAAERQDIYAYDENTATELRHVRQGVANSIDSPAALKDYWKRTRALTNKVNDAALSALDPARIAPMADQAQAMYQQFKADRLQAGMGGA